MVVRSNKTNKMFQKRLVGEGGNGRIAVAGYSRTACFKIVQVLDQGVEVISFTAYDVFSPVLLAGVVSKSASAALRAKMRAAPDSLTVLDLGRICLFHCATSTSESATERPEEVNELTDKEYISEASLEASHSCQKTDQRRARPTLSAPGRRRLSLAVPWDGDA